MSNKSLNVIYLFGFRVFVLYFKLKDNPHFLGNEFPDHLSQLAVGFGENRDILVSIDDENLRRGDHSAAVPVDKPVLVEAVEALQELHAHVGLLGAAALPNAVDDDGGFGPEIH